MISPIHSCGPIAGAPGICEGEFVENEPCPNFLPQVISSIIGTKGHLPEQRRDKTFLGDYT